MKLVNRKLNDSKTKFLVHIKVKFRHQRGFKTFKIVVFTKNMYEAEKEAKKKVSKWDNYQDSRIFMVEDLVNHTIK